MASILETIFCKNSNLNKKEEEDAEVSDIKITIGVTKDLIFVRNRNLRNSMITHTVNILIVVIVVEEEGARGEAEDITEFSVNIDFIRFILKFYFNKGN